MTYQELSTKANPDKAPELALVLLRIYDANQTGNNGAVMGEAVLCPYFSEAAEHALKQAGVLP